MAIGVVVAFTPTIGVQIGLALLLSTLLGGNRPLSVVSVWITNPATMVPLYAFTYWVGSWFWPGPPVERARGVIGEIAAVIAHAEPWQLSELLRALAAVGRDVFVPLWIGGLLVGLVAAVPTYVGTVALVREARRRRARRAGRRRARGAERPLAR